MKEKRFLNFNSDENAPDTSARRESSFRTVKKKILHRSEKSQSNKRVSEKSSKSKLSRHFSDNFKRSFSKEHEAAYKRDFLLVKQILLGDTEAFAELMSLYKNRVEALGMGFFKNPADTEDFVQDVFLKAFMKLSQFRGESLFSTWLTRMAYNLAVNSVKRRAEYVSIADDDILPDNALTPEEAKLRELTKEAVHEAIKELDEKYRVCLDLYFFYDNSYAEISEITALPENTVKSHIFRAKKILREKLIAKGMME